MRKQLRKPNDGNIEAGTGPEMEGRQGKEKLWRQDRDARRMMGFRRRRPSTVLPPSQRPPLRQAMTGAQRVKMWKNEAYAASDTRATESGLFREARAVKSVASRLRELELHPERRDAIRARP